VPRRQANAARPTQPAAAPKPVAAPATKAAKPTTALPRIVSGPANFPGQTSIWSGVVLRLEFPFPDKRIVHAGTGFIIQNLPGTKYLITCAHLIDQEEWRRRDKIQIRTMDGTIRIESLGPPLLLGQSVDLKHVMPNGRPDMTKDLVVRSIAGMWTKPIPLSRTDPRVGDWVWAVGCEAGQRLTDEKLYPGKVVEVSNGGYLFEPYQKFNPHGFSGGPVVNTRGEVVGNVIAGGSKVVGGATVTAIRQRLRDHGIYAD
jgi:S1-C subfamily serine protease